jgi:beta-glucosidase
MRKGKTGALVAGGVAAAGAAGAVLKAGTRRWTQAAERPEGLDFPQGFRFGAATSAHQVEGGTHNTWTRWEARPDGRGEVVTGDRRGRAADHWNRFEDDLELMCSLGIDTYRFSIEWSRLEPSEGVFDDAALDRYRSWCRMLRAAGIAPMITLHHFAEPVWFAERGGFEARESVDAFVRFVEHVAPALADVCDRWVTINEPGVYAFSGWCTGEFPPGKADLALTGTVLEHVLLAHARAYHTLHRFDNGAPCRVSLAKNVIPAQPLRVWNPADVAAARR